MGASKAYRIQIYPSRAVHLLLKEMAQESGQTISKTAASLIEQALNDNSVLNEVRLIKGDQRNIYEQLVNLLTINVATADYLLKKTCSPSEAAEAKQAISERTNALRMLFIGGNDDAGN
ncbi:hypothetical protein [Vibrio cholerae]|uniref:hypothetical protein n=1 Tax=Vibrio cholerae TaxID=666 RepID=UPI002AB54662|nr:hypothetical protein [Vibrio cholerae]MDY7587529.1 hypothetical protein [Vibrio cholerae]